MVAGEVAQIKIGDYLIYKKEILVCTNVIDITQTGIPCFCFEEAFEEAFVEEIGDDGPGIAIWDLPEMLKIKATRIDKDSKRAKNLELLYAKV